MSTTQVDDAVKALLKEHGYLQLVEVGEGEQKRVRIRCDLTQHELLPRTDAIESYLKTKKFIKAKEWYCYDYSKYEPYIVQHRRKPKSLFCNVTSTILNRIPEEVEKHVKGKKFLRLKEHVKFSKGGEDDGEEDDAEFDGNAFEFENQQLIYSDEEDEDGKPAKKGGNHEDDDDDDEGDDGSDDDEIGEDEEDEESDGGEGDDVMADFYPKEDDDESEDEHIREAVKRLTVKKRKASTDATSGENDATEEVKPKAKKQKAMASADAAKAESTHKSGKAKASKPVKSSHNGKQKKGSK